jgi:hypothetical protein
VRLRYIAGFSRADDESIRRSRGQHEGLFTGDPVCPLCRRGASFNVGELKACALLQMCERQMLLA